MRPHPLALQFGHFVSPKHSLPVAPGLLIRVPRVGAGLPFPLGQLGCSRLPYPIALVADVGSGARCLRFASALHR